MEKEVEMAPPCKSKKKKGKDGVGLSKAWIQKMIPSPIAQSKGGIEASVGSPIKKFPTIPKMGKGEENVKNCQCMWICIIWQRSLVGKVIFC